MTKPKSSPADKAKASLADLAAQIRAHLHATSEGTRGAAILLAQSKHHFTSALAWLSWTAGTFNLSRRSTFLYAKVGELFNRRPDLVQHVALRDLAKAEMLANLGARLDEFMAGHDCEELSRDELRDAIAVFQGKPRAKPADKPKAITAEQLMLNFADPAWAADVTIDTCWEVAEAALTACQKKLSPDNADDRAALALSLRKLADQIDPPKAVTL